MGRLFLCQTDSFAARVDAEILAAVKYFDLQRGNWMGLFAILLTE